MQEKEEDTDMSSLEKAITKIIEIAIEVGYDEENAEDYINKETLVAMAMGAIAANTRSDD